MSRRVIIFRLTLACLILVEIAFVSVGSEMLFRKWNGIEVFPSGEIRPKTAEEHYVYTLFRFSESNVLYYEPNPNARYRKYTINEHGFRGRPYSIEKPENTTRVVILGDSIVWGHLLDETDTISAVLETRLNRAANSRNFEVLNFGVSGYSTQQEVEMYIIRARNFDPDIVVVGFCLNDFEESSVEARPFKRITLGMRSKSYLWESVNRRLYHLFRQYFGISIQPHFVLKNVDLRKEFERLGQYVDSRVLLVIYPELIDFENYALDHLHADVTESVRGLEVDVLDLLDTFRPYAPDDLKVSPEDVTHPNAFANGLVADQIVEYLMGRSDTSHWFE